MRRKGHSRRPNASTCSRFSPLKISIFGLKSETCEFVVNYSISPSGSIEEKCLCKQTSRGAQIRGGSRNQVNQASNLVVLLRRKGVLGQYEDRLVSALEDWVARSRVRLRVDSWEIPLEIVAALDMAMRSAEQRSSSPTSRSVGEGVTHSS